MPNNPQNWKEDSEQCLAGNVRRNPGCEGWIEHISRSKRDVAHRQYRRVEHEPKERSTDDQQGCEVALLRDDAVDLDDNERDVHHECDEGYADHELDRTREPRERREHHHPGRHAQMQGKRSGLERVLGNL